MDNREGWEGQGRGVGRHIAGGWSSRNKGSARTFQSPEQPFNSLIRGQCFKQITNTLQLALHSFHPAIPLLQCNVVVIVVIVIVIIIVIIIIIDIIIFIFIVTVFISIPSFWSCTMPGRPPIVMYLFGVLFNIVIAFHPHLHARAFKGMPSISRPVPPCVRPCARVCVIFKPSLSNWKVICLVAWWRYWNLLKSISMLV